MIAGVASYVPEDILTNEELSKMVDTTDEWITTRVGIKTRHILKGEGLGSSKMGSRAELALLMERMDFLNNALDELKKEQM